MAMTEATSSRIASAAGNVPGIRLRRGGPARGWRHWLPFYVMLAPGLLFFIIWHYVPIWQVQMAFQQVRIIPPNFWVVLKNFELLFSSPVFYQVILNTLIISGMKLCYVFPVPIVVALLLN